MNELARLFNANTSKKVGYACKGGSKSQTEYSVQFDNNEEFYISKGMKYFDENLQREIDIFKQFSNNKQAMLDKLLEMQEIDNINSKARDLKEYKIISLDYLKNGIQIRWFYLTTSVNGQTKNICETNLNCAVFWGMEKLINYINNAKSSKFWVASGLSESEVDFIFHGYGYCSISDLYTVKIQTYEDCIVNV